MNIFEKLLKFRLHVYMLTFLLILIRYVPYYSIDLNIFLAALSFASLMAFIYILNKATDIKEDKINVKSGSIEKKSTKKLTFSAFILFFVPLFYVITVPKLLLIYSLVAMNGFLYSYRLPIFGKKFRIKDKLIVKNVSSAFTWAAPPALIPIAIRNSISINDIIGFIVIFFITMSLEIVWDIRDVKGDRKYGIKTIPNTFGLTKTKIICLILLSLVLLLMLKYQYYYSTLTALFLSYIFIFTARNSRSSMFFHALVLLWVIFIFIGLVFKI